MVYTHKKVNIRVNLIDEQNFKSTTTILNNDYILRK